MGDVALLSLKNKISMSPSLSKSPTTSCLVLSRQADLVPCPSSCVGRWFRSRRQRSQGEGELLNNNRLGAPLSPFAFATTISRKPSR